jgi:hypothetical protein
MFLKYTQWIGAKVSGHRWAERHNGIAGICVHEQADLARLLCNRVYGMKCSRTKGLIACGAIESAVSMGQSNTLGTTRNPD